MFNQKLLSGAVVLLVVVLGLVWWGSRYFLPSAPGATHQVVLTENGFGPEVSNIHRGDTVIFRSMTGKHFWPASDLHPTHLLYPEFDPREPIRPQDTWQFRFDRPGRWTFHDHLSPYFTGTINVE